MRPEKLVKRVLLWMAIAVPLAVIFCCIVSAIVPDLGSRWTTTIAQISACVLALCVVDLWLLKGKDESSQETSDHNESVQDSDKHEMGQ